MANIVIYATSNSDQTGVVLTDKTDWTALGVPRTTLTIIRLDLFGQSLVTPKYTYTLSSAERLTYVNSGKVEILFLSLSGSINISDGWWSLYVNGNAGAYTSNYSGFGIYADITYAVFSQINSLHTPEETKYNAEKFCRYAIYLKGLGYLDTTNVNSRDIKFTKRLLSLQKMLLPI